MSPASRFLRSTLASTSRCGRRAALGARRRTGYRACFSWARISIAREEACCFGCSSSTFPIRQSFTSSRRKPPKDLPGRVHVHRDLQPNDARLIALYASCDVLVLPTKADLVPWAVLEAMAMQLPVVSTGVGAIPEIVVHDVTGFIVPAGDAEALANAIAGLLSDPDLRRTMGQRGRERIESDFDAAINVPRILAVMKSLADGRRSRALGARRERAPRWRNVRAAFGPAPRGCTVPRSSPRKRRHRSIAIKDRECLGHRQVWGAEKEAVHFRVLPRPVVSSCLRPQAVIDRDGVDDPHPERPTLDLHGPDEIQPP